MDVNTDYTEEVTCQFRGETYSVRDNGAVKRHARPGLRRRKLDEVWTFGQEGTDKYMFINGVRVHQIVATAFYGDQGKEGKVVDHKDTNRCNNRPENLHWVTRVENALNNPITRKRIVLACGSVEAFLENPSVLKGKSLGHNLDWMCTVIKEEAANCKANLERWAAEDVEPKKPEERRTIGPWILEKYMGEPMHMGEPKPTPLPQVDIRQVEPPKPEFYDSLTPNALQEDWKTPTAFVCCPQGSLSLEDYCDALKVGRTFQENTYGEGEVEDFALVGDKLCVMVHMPGSIKEWGVTLVYIKDDKYIHQSHGTYFERNGAAKAITLFRGEEWTGGPCYDDYC